MKRISIGNTPQSNIVLSSQFVSRNHAELLLLYNGDMLLVDNGSSNGTFVNGNRIAPNTEVLVTRADTVFCADKQLNWGAVQPLSTLVGTKVVKGIGSHYRNAVRVEGPHVSRFHATVKQMNNGKWFICDHSSNGTTLNGRRIQKDQWTPLKKGDMIACAGTNTPNPANAGGGSSSVKGLILGICACLLLGVGVFAAMKFLGTSVASEDQPKSTVMIETRYYYRAHVNIYGKHLEGRYGINSKGKVGALSEKYTPIGACATGFFLDEKGVIATNDHVTRPWMYGDDAQRVDDIKEKIKLQFLQTYGLQISSADVQVDGVLHNIAIIPNGRLYDESNMLSARYLMSADDPNVDLAIIQTMKERLPEGTVCVPLKSMVDKSLEQGSDLISWGFPIPDQLQDMDNWERFVKSKLQAVLSNGKVTMVNKYDYMHNADSFHGASGSPVFNEKGQLVGVISSGMGILNYNHCVKSKYLIRLYNRWLKEIESNN